MDLQAPEVMRSRRTYLFGLSGTLIGFLAAFNSRSIEIVVIGAIIGLIGGVSARYGINKDSAHRKSAIFVTVVSVVLLLFLTMVGGAGLHCHAYIPYEARNIFTGEIRRFTYGGCGPQPHPWYYEPVR